MRPGREIDTEIAMKIFGHDVWVQAEVLFEKGENGDDPLRSYSREIDAAMEVVKRMKMTLIPIVGNQWFAFVGPKDINGWQSPGAVLEFLGAGKFEGCGAAVGTDLPGIICEAALKAVEKRENEQTTAPQPQPQFPHHLKPVPGLTH